MMTPRELFLELLKPDGQPDRQLCQYEALHMCLNDPINTYLRGNRKRGTVSKDRWGTTISFPADAPGPMPVTADGLAVCPDVTHWRDTVHAPDIDSCTEGWEACRTAARAACGQEKLLAGFMGTGIFEQCHFLMGFEDTLTNLYEHPDEMRQLIEYIAAASGEPEADILTQIAGALARGQQKKLLTLCRQALAQGVAPQDILSGGLIQGMNRLGEDFSANRAFVPEMLMAARCMTAALAELKPLMTGEAGRTVGRACIGTVRGDMHDIGKNLVKIMLEGSGVEVVDLGVDVTPEQFVETAQRESCGIIACSSLLTTTMQEMRRVVALAEEKGIRDRVKIFVGGAPISQSFCDEIGADVYTEDAAAAARAAVEALNRA